METTSEKLTTKQRLFVDAYLGEARFNATKAAKIAGYSGDDVTLASVGYENLRKPQISEKIRETLQARSASREECIARVTQRARGSAENLFTESFGERVVSIEKAFETGEIHNVKKVKEGKYGLEIELYDAQQADALLIAAHDRIGPSGETDAAVIEIPSNNR